MGKKQMIALGIITACFVAFFYKGFLDITTASPFVSLFCFVGLVFGTVFSIYIGNSGTR
jgi:preprotein translocase subunit SecY|tara:strand:- start:885 stop:1061 length:177 start_codon:yes stop_codon:yes gene_type:complete